jgi:beta-lactamase regulating signal transducer with metallopeptidase domain
MIDPLLRGLESVFSWLVEASWQASVLVALVLLLQVVLRGRLNPRWHHALWLLVIARLMLPFLPESALSLYQFAPPPPAKLAVSMSEPLFAPGPLLSPIEFPTVKSEAVEGGHSFTFYSLLALIWLTGAVALLILTWKVNRRFARHVAASPLVTDPRLINLAVAAQQELGVHRWLRIIESPQVKSPAIMGLFRPTLILPRDVRARFADSELRFIFLHEFAHLRRGDLFLQWLVALLQILHWFNPVLWYAFRRMRADREPATDALVLSCTGETDKESYGQVLVKLLEHYHTRNSLPTLVGILEDKDQFKRRFSLIARFTSGAYGWSILGVLLIVFLSVACLTKSKATESSAPASRVVSTSAADTVASKPTSASVSAPAVDASKRQIQLEFKLIEIDEKTYLSHRSDIDRAVANFDLVSLVSAVNHLPGTALLSAPVVTTQDGLKANVDFLREMPYVTRNDKDKDGKMVPSDFKIRHLGLSILTLPTLMADGTTVDLWFMCHVGSFRGWKEASPGVKQPVF